MSAIPVLEPGCGSWVVSADNGRKVFETFSSVTAERAANSEALPASPPPAAEARK